jgi:hypothetical protein
VLKSSWMSRWHGRTRFTLQNSGKLAYIKKRFTSTASTLTVDLYGHLVPAVNARGVDGPKGIRELSAGEPMMSIGHKESNMSEATSHQGIKIYTANG